MGNDAGGSGVTIDLTSDPENVDVPAGNKRSGTTKRRLMKRSMGSLEGDVFIPSVVREMEKVDEGGEVKKGHRKRSKFFIVSKVQGGDDGLVKKDVGKRKLGLNKKCGKKGLVDEEKEHEEDVDNDVRLRKRSRKSKLVGEAVDKNKGEKGVGCKVPDVDRIHQRISLWSLHCLLPKLSTKQREDVKKMGFGAVLGFRIKDVPTRLSYWLLDNFDENRCVLNVDGKEISITKEKVRDVLGIPMGNVYDSQDLPHFECFTPEKLVVGRQESGVSGNVSNGAITPYTICDVAPLPTIIPNDTNVRPKRYSRKAEVLCSPWGHPVPD
ncbi:hypothetical protein CTI12_AA545600 [Artemisia annua]|uniref:Ulp1 protease family, C-terminal catalytic domain-containing protein n=1 Tax=Artemisia annua TaxID=35608 RepID=A0A2U1L028_ARTAN|nr:hypothetical protein CTI12_AA545600 [Artemisia annua]